MRTLRERVDAACASGLLIDGMVTHTGDDLALLLSHVHGTGARAVHEFAWNCFVAATEVAKKEGL